MTNQKTEAGSHWGAGSPASQQRSWFTTYQFMAEALAQANTGPLPAAGTPQWCNLADGDPRKLLALAEAGVHHVLRIDAAQTEQAQISRDLSTDDEWIAAVATDVRNHPHHRIRRAS